MDIACLVNDREEVEASESENLTRVEIFHEQEPVPDAASKVEQLKSQGQYQATYDMGVSDQVVATVEHDLGNEEFTMMLALACAINIMGMGINEEAGLSNKKNIITDPGEEPVVKKAAQGVIVDPEATDDDGGSHEGKNIDEAPDIAGGGLSCLLPAQKQHCHVVAVWMNTEKQGRGLD